MAVWIISGRQRHGKNLLALDIIEQGVKAGRPVLVNFDLTRDCPYFDQVYRIGTKEFPVFRELPKIRGMGRRVEGFWDNIVDGSIVIIDEADIEMDCLRFADMPDQLRMGIKEMGKAGVDVYFIVQKVENLYNRILRQAEGVFWCVWTWRSSPRLKYLARLTSPDYAIGWSRFVRYEFSGPEMSRTQLRRQAWVPYRVIQQKYFRRPWYDTHARRVDEFIDQQNEQQAAAGPAQRVPRPAAAS